MNSGNFCCFWEKIEFVRVWDSCVLDEVHQVHMNLDDFDLFLVEREKEKVFVMSWNVMIDSDLDFDCDVAYIADTCNCWTNKPLPCGVTNSWTNERLTRGTGL
jgi:hypothetical protein